MCMYVYIHRKKVFIKDSMWKRNKVFFLIILLPWLSNELWSINKLKQRLWCIIYIYIYIYIWIQSKISGERFFFSSFDNRDSFPFSILRMRYLRGNMPSKIFYSSLWATIIRISRTATEIQNFKSPGAKTIFTMIK